MEIVKKLSTGKLIGKVKSFLPDSRSDVTPVQVARIIGMARGIKTGVSTFGDYTALTGDFVFEPSVGPNAGKRYRSGTLFMPDVALDLVTPHINGKDAVELAFAILARNDETSEVGYCYGAEFLIAPETNDPMNALLERAMPKAPAELPAPDAGEEKPKEGAKK